MSESALAWVDFAVYKCEQIENGDIGDLHNGGGGMIYIF